MTTSIKCEATSKKGTPCKATARLGMKTCSTHNWYGREDEKATMLEANRIRNEENNREWAEWRANNS